MFGVFAKLFFAFLLVSFDLSCGQVPFRHHHAHTAASARGKEISVLAAHTCIHACMHTYIHTYIHRYIPSFHTPSFFLTYHLSHTFRSFTTSFVFPSFPVGMITSHKARRKSLQNLRLHSAEHYIQAYKHTCIHAYMHTYIHT